MPTQPKSVPDQPRSMSIDKQTTVSIGMLVVVLSGAIWMVTSIERLVAQTERRNEIQEISIQAWRDVLAAKNPEIDVPEIRFRNP